MSGKVQQTRTYRKRRRAEGEAQTRNRITEATVALHREVGPARTTISAVAERAGVQRLTVYRHFPEEADLIGACSAHWRAGHPMPDPRPWAAIADPEERLRTALGELYAYYRTDAAMIANVRRDAPSVPALAAVTADLPHYFAAARAILARGWGVRGRRRALLLAALGHVIEFETWRSLERGQGLAPADVVDLAAGAVRAAARY
jgi:AcrR family transcriptional regulator